MLPTRFLAPGALALAAALGAAMPACAQTEITAQPNPEADRLAEEMRALAADPRDLSALLEAGRLSARLGDTSAAIAFFQRAEAIEPADPRIAAGRGMALVRLERPGEALRLFQTAEAAGIPVRDYASDRGFAYDLLGHPDRAQRDYRLVMAGGGDDETARRYALSLGITGDTDEAMRVLDPLLRRSDRAAWRARAFILAMNGDVTGAERIAASMMPGNMGESLIPFFRRLETLAPADRAFAVHFGELSPTQARLADARLAPDLPRYVPAPRAVEVAAAVSPPQSAPQPKKSRHSRGGREPLPAPAPAPAPAPVKLAAADLPTPPQFAAERAEIVQPLPATPAPVRDETPPQPRAEAPAAEPVRVAAAPEPQAPGPSQVGREDAVLAAIVNNITIPAEELEAVTARPAAVPAPEPAPVHATGARPQPAAEKSRTSKPAKPDVKARKPESKKPAPPKPDPARAEPRRVWVQVAGGANEDMLARAWKGVVAKAPAPMKGKSAWWAPLRATNRVLAGPFKTSAEAQTFVNALGKSGVSAFVFTSEPGQKISKLALK